MSILDIFSWKRESVQITASAEAPARKIICYRCDREIDEQHQVEGCRKSAMSRRFFFGLAGASAAALALRLEGVPLPVARVQVVAYAGDMFEVETLGAFTLAWEGAKTRHGNPFKTDDGLIQDGGLLEFHGQDVSRPDQWLRVHRGLAEMNVLGLVDKATGKPVKYRIVRAEEADKRVGIAVQRVKSLHGLRMSSGQYLGQPTMVVTERESTIRDVPVDSKKVDRQGVKYAGYAGFKIKYTAEKSQEYDTVRITVPVVPRKTADERYLCCPWDEQRMVFTASLHHMINMVNRWYPEYAEKLRLKIMSCNPEYRRRLAPVRSVETVTA